MIEALLWAILAVCVIGTACLIMICASIHRDTVFISQAVQYIIQQVKK